MRKTTAETVIIPTMNVYTNPARNAEPIRGTTMRQKVARSPAPSAREASSMAGSSWWSLEIPASIPTGSSRKAVLRTRIARLPVSTSGGVLKSRMYPTPITVPGTASPKRAANSRAVRPGTRRRAIR
jgi:hypothetical protein